MPAAKAKRVSKSTKTTKRPRASKKSESMSLSWKIIAAIVFVPFFAVAALAVGMTVSYASAPEVTYDTISDAAVDSVPGTYFERQHIAELGSQVRLAGTERNNTNVTVLMTSMACESGTWDSNCQTTPGATFNHPVTLNVYRVGPDNTVGARIASVTKSFAIPYRPTSTSCNGVAHAWSDEDGVCHTEKSFTLDFNVVPVEKAEGDTSAGTVIPMPDNVIVAVAFNTQNEGYTPLGVPGPYNFIGMAGTGAPRVGESLPTASDAYVNYGPEAQYCFESGPGDDTLRLDPYSLCWTGILPGLKITSSAATTTTPPPVIPPTPTTKMPKTADECKKDGWKAFTYKFKNQGDCVSYTQNGKL